jgi:hypothetical protein
MDKPISDIDKVTEVILYFPAQPIHMDKDRPRDAADLIIDNDPYLAGPLRSKGDVASMGATSRSVDYFLPREGELHASRKNDPEKQIYVGRRKSDRHQRQLAGVR